MFEKDPEAVRFGATPIDNVFIREYLPAAKGDYVKVYLYALMASGEDDSDMPSLCRDLDMDQAEVEAALRYWERRALVTRATENPPTYVFHSPVQRFHAQKDAPLAVDIEYVDFSESLYLAFGDRRKLRPADIALAYEWVKELGLKQEVVLMLVNHAIANNGVNFSFKRMDAVAARMKDDDVLSAEDAEKFLRGDLVAREDTRTVLRRMGKRRMPSEDEVLLYIKWRDEWQFGREAVLSACAEMTKGDPSFKYLDAILQGIRARGDAQTAAQVTEQLVKEKDEAARAYKLSDSLGLKSLSRGSALALYRAARGLYDDEDIIEYAVSACRQKASPTGEDLIELLKSWRDKGYDKARVKEHVTQFIDKNRALRELFELAGHNARPTAADRALYDQWMAWGYDMPMLRFAAEQSRGATGNRVAYLKKVVETWHEAGVTEVSQAIARKPGTKEKPGKTVTAQRYEQREYGKEELSAAAEDMLEEVRKKRG